MARAFQFTNSFSAGEIAPEFVMRNDLKPRAEGLKKARNVRLLQGGGFKRRFGSYDLFGLTDDAVAFTLGKTNQTLLLFMPTKFQHHALDGSLIQEVTGAPWDADDIRTMQVSIAQDAIVIASSSFFPQQLSRVGSGPWSLADFDFLDGLNGAIRQPYWRYADPGVTIAVSAYTGAVNIVSSAAAFVAGHVGTRIRYLGIEILITGYTNSTHVAGTVVGSLYPQLDITVGSTSGYLPGQAVQGEDTQVKGVVTAIVSPTVVSVQLTDGYTSPSTTENLVSPTGVSAISAVSVDAAPAALSSWDEQMISAVHGYPAACAFHRTRLLFGDFPAAKNALAASAVGQINDFDVGSGLDSDAIIESMGQDADLEIKHFGSTEQLILLTGAGAKYVPEQVGAPLSPTNIECLDIGPEADGLAAPVLASEGLMFVESESGRLLIAIPTGNVRHSWDITDLSEMAFHLMGVPVKLALMAANAAADRLIFALRNDGKLAVMYYPRGGSFTAWTPWDTNGVWRSVTVADSALYVIARRTINGLTAYRLERMDDAVYGDGCVPMPAGNIAYLNGQTCAVWTPEGAKIGEFPIAAGAVTGLPSGIADYVVGFDFTLEAETVPPIDPNTGVSRRGRISRTWFGVVNTIGVRVNGNPPVGFTPTTGIGGAVTPYTGDLIFYGLGRSREPTVTITQTEGGPLQIGFLTAEVTN